MSREFLFSNEARAKITNGVNILANAVKVTLGPKGRNVVIGKQYGAPHITKDGVSVAKEVVLADKFENMGAQLVKEVASRTADVAGDGTTTATVLAQAIINLGMNEVNNGYDPMQLKRELEIASKAIIKNIEKYALPCSTNKEIEQIATISANSDTVVGKLIAQAMDRVGKDGVITVEEGTGFEDSLTVVEGMQFDRGYLSPFFVTNQTTLACELENPFILVVDKKISTFKEMLTVLEGVTRNNKPLLIIADDVEGEALSTLVYNKMRNIIKVCAVKAPGFGSSRKSMLQDIAILTDGVVVADEVGVPLDKATINECGVAKKVIITKDTTTIIDGEGSKISINNRVDSIKSEIEYATSDYEKQKLQERMAKLTGGVAIIKVGAVTEIEMKEKTDRVDDALHATRAAIEGGIVPGGGIALFNASKMVKEEFNLSSLGADILLEAITEPLKQITFNAGVNGIYESLYQVYISKHQTVDYFYGYNAATDRFGNMLDMGIIDPAKVTCTALENAVSIAGLILTTECMITAEEIQQ